VYKLHKTVRNIQTKLYFQYPDTKLHLLCMRFKYIILKTRKTKYEKLKLFFNVQNNIMLMMSISNNC